MVWACEDAAAQTPITITWTGGGVAAPGDPGIWTFDLNWMGGSGATPTPMSGDTVVFNDAGR